MHESPTSSPSPYLMMMGPGGAGTGSTGRGGLVGIGGPETSCCSGGGLGGLFGGSRSNSSNNKKKRSSPSPPLLPPLSSSLSSSSSSSPDDTDAVGVQVLVDEIDLAKAMNELSVEEREKVYDDIHGCVKKKKKTMMKNVNEAPSEEEDEDIDDSIETTEFISQKIEQLNKAIDDLPRTKRTYLDRAIFLKPSLLTSDIKFKLMFLRVTEYNVRLAAKRLAKYFEDKVDVWGEDKIVKTITLTEDFTKDDMDLWMSGPFTAGPRKDAVGRTILFNDVSKFRMDKPKSMTRCAWYFIMSTLQQDEECQLNGMINLVFCPKKFPKFHASPHDIFQRMVKEGEMLQNLPVSVKSQHVCYSNPALEFFIKCFRTAFGKSSGLRLRAHFGSDIEIQYTLLTYGISCPYLLNVDINTEKDKLHQNNTKKLIELERQQQQQTNNEAIATNVVQYPTSKDVLVGRGCPYQTYVGNVMLSDMVTPALLQRYNCAIDKFEKTCIHLGIVKAVHNLGGRFLERKPSAGGWTVVPEKVARKKVNSLFRSKMAKFTTTTTANTAATLNILSTTTTTTTTPPPPPLPPPSNNNNNMNGGSICHHHTNNNNNGSSSFLLSSNAIGYNQNNNHHHQNHHQNNTNIASSFPYYGDEEKKRNNNNNNTNTFEQSLQNINYVNSFGMGNGGGGEGIAGVSSSQVQGQCPSPQGYYCSNNKRPRYDGPNLLLSSSS